MDKQIKSYIDEIEGAEVRELPLINNLIMELKTEKVDALVMSNEPSISYTETNDDLTEYLNEIIDELIEQDLVEKWKAEAKILSDKESK